MKIINFPSDYLGTFIGPLADLREFVTVTTLVVTMDAVGESPCAIFRVYIEGGGSKTISAAGGGKIYFGIGTTLTFNNAATRVQVGLQGVGPDGKQDNVFQVSHTLVQGVDTLTAPAVNVATMSSGSMTLNHGDLVAVVGIMTARGSGDVVRFLRRDAFSNFPYTTANVGLGPIIQGIPPMAAIEFDDGTLGFTGGSPLCDRTTNTSFNVNSAIDEYALIFTFPYNATITTIQAHLGAATKTADFEFILYEDPLGTPNVVYSEEIDTTYIGSTSGNFINFVLPTGVSITANQQYALAIRPTTTSNVTLRRLNFRFPELKRQTVLGSDWSLGTRANQTGAFTEVSAELPIIGFYLKDISIPDTGIIHTF